MKKPSKSKKRLATPTSPDLIAKRRQAMQCIEAFINFFYLVSTPTLAESHFDYIEEALTTFWENVEVFVKYSKSGFNFPKMHAMTKYLACFRENGAPANYNSEHSERQHIRDVKIPYRESNRVNALESGQMIRSVNIKLALEWKRRRLGAAHASDAVQKRKDSPHVHFVGTGKRLSLVFAMQRLGGPLGREFVLALRYHLLGLSDHPDR
jgi:hypothetical protein